MPNDEKALEPVLEKARKAGIKVIAHEGPGIKNKDWDFELASAKGFGEAHAELLAKTMGGKGEYAVLRRLADGSAAQRLGGRGNRLSQGQVSRHEAGRRTVMAWPKTSTTAARPRSI